MYEILIAEDDEIVRTNIAFLLKKNGYETITAENGRMAFELAEKRLPDLILSDIKMPELNGFEFREKLLSNPKTEYIPFVFLSLKADHEDIRKGMLAGADDYLVKPFRANDLLETIKIRLFKSQKIQNRFNELSAEIVKNLQHELRTPLVPILGFSQLMLQNDYSLSLEEISKMAEMIHASGNKLLNQIEKFFSYSDLVLLPKNSARVKKSEDQFVINIKKKISEFANKMAALYDRQFDIALNLCDGYVCISELHLKKMIDELLQNAFSFSIPGSEVSVTSEVVKDNYIIQIKDNGIGITEEYQNYLASMNNCPQDYAKEKRGGLGMAIVNRIIDLYKGEIKITSKPGKFTCVTIFLKLKIQALNRELF